MKLLEEAEVAVSPAAVSARRARVTCAWPWSRTNSGCGRQCDRWAAACDRNWPPRRLTGTASGGVTPPEEAPQTRAPSGGRVLWVPDQTHQFHVCLPVGEFGLDGGNLRLRLGRGKVDHP